MPVAATAAQPSPVDIRPRVPGDDPFLFATWLNHAKGSSRYGRALERDAFFSAFHRTADALLRRPSTRVLVATPKGGEEIVGYLITDEMAGKPVVHFGFVKKFARGHGVFRSLWTATGIDGNEAVWTCPTDAEPWVKQRFPSIEVLDFFR